MTFWMHSVLVIFVISSCRDEEITRVRVAKDDVRAIPESLLKAKQEIVHDSLPFKLLIRGYQASFGKDDTLSVLQVVRNPGWTLPYLSCLMVAAGLLWHFGLSLRRSFTA